MKAKIIIGVMALVVLALIASVAFSFGESASDPGAEGSAPKRLLSPGSGPIISNTDPTQVNTISAMPPGPAQKIKDMSAYVSGTPGPEDYTPEAWKALQDAKKGIGFVKNADGKWEVASDGPWNWGEDGPPKRP